MPLSSHLPCHVRPKRRHGVVAAVKRINLKFLFIFLAIVIGGGVGVFLLRRFQVLRNAGNLQKMAKLRLEEGKAAEAMVLYSRYIGLRPEDSAAYAEYAKLMLGRAEAPDATRNDLARAYNTLEAAVRRNPDDDDLRRRLAEFQLRIGREMDAREHLAILRERVESGKIPAAPAASPDGAGAAGSGTPTGGGDGTEDRKPLDANQIDLLTAKSYMAAGDFELAAKLVSSMVGFDLESRTFQKDREAGGDTEAFIILAAVLEDKLNDREAASGVLEKLIEAQGTDVVAWLARSSWHRQHGNNAAAEADIAKALEIDPDNANALFAGFEIAASRKDFDAAESLARKALELYPGDERVYRGLASVALQRGDAAAAEQVLLDGVEQLPNKASLLLMLADTRLQQNKLEEVEQTIARIKDIYGVTSPAVGLLEGRLLVASGKWADAKAKLETIRPLVIGSPELVRQVDLYLGQCHAQLDEYDAQLDVNRRVLSEDPGSLAARAGTAAALAAAGKPEEALEEFEAIAKALPPEKLASVPQLWYPLLQLRMQRQAKLPAVQRDWSSVDALLDALQQSPDVNETQLTLLRADALVRKGEIDSARELLETATKAGGEPQVWAALATLMLRTKGPDAAAETIASAPADMVASPTMLVVKAQVAGQRRDEQGKKTLAELEQQAATLPKDEAANVFTTLAAVQLLTGDVVSSERLWREVAARRPDDIRPREAVLELVLNQGDLEKARAAAAEVAEAAGTSSARARVADASVRIFEIREAVQKRKESGDGKAELTPEEKAALDEVRNLLIEAENDRPGWSQIQTLFADVDSLRGDSSAAIDRLKKAVTLGPANPMIVRRLVAMLYSSNRLEEAQKAMESLGAEGAQGLDRLTAEMELRSGKTDEAVALAERSVSLDSGSADDLLWLGQVLERSGKRDRASDALLRATEVAPERSDVWLALFSLQVAEGKKPIAERTLEKAADLLSAPKRQLTLAQGYEMLGRSNDAEQAFRDAAAAAPDDLEVDRQCAAFLLRSGREAEARETLRKIADSTTKSQASDEVRAWSRRTLAELIAQRGNFRESQKAMDLLAQNLDDKGNISPDDLLLQVRLLTNRPEPASWKRAIDVLEELGRSQRLSMGQRIMLSQLKEKVGRWDECRNELVAIAATPSVPPAYVAMLIEKLIDHGEPGAARPWLTRLQKLSPDSAICIALEAKLAIAQKDRKLAAESARKLMPGGVVTGSEPGQLNAVAKLMEQLGFPKAADKVFTQFAETSAEGVIARAEFLARQKRTEEAIDLLETRWNDLPLEGLFGAVIQAVRANDDPAAVAPRIAPWFVKAKRIDPGSIVIRMLEAELVTLEGRPADAEKIYRDLLAQEDLDKTQKAVVSNNLAFHLAKPDTVGEAQKLVESAIDELGPLPDLLDTRGMIRLAAGENKEAVSDFMESILQPTEVKYLHLALAQLRAGDEGGAKQSLEAGRQRGLEPTRLSPEDRQRLGELEAALGTQAPPGAEPQG
jgi:cellulose synthase operon protein C